MPIARTLLAGLLLGMATTAPATGPLFEPVYKTNFPDPFILEHQGEFIAYSTNDGENLPMATSRNLVDWRPVADPARPGRRLDGMPKLAPWVKEGFTWAPEVMQIAGKWLLYYTANHRKKDLQCLGIAISDNPKGPFRDGSSDPLVCQDKLGGTIDANPFRDRDGKLYLYYKSDGNRVRKNTVIWGQRMAPDGLSVTGDPVELLKDDLSWEMKVVEAPSMVAVPGGYAMFYSAGYYGWNEGDRLSPYAMGYATCAGPLGPCTDAPKNPILYSYNKKDVGCLSGPGHQVIFRAKGGTFIGFHGWAKAGVCRKAADARYLYIAPFGWEDGKPVIANGLRAAGK